MWVVTAVAVAAGVVGKSPHRAQAVDIVVGMRIARGPAAGRKAAFAAAWAAASVGWAVHWLLHQLLVGLLV